MSRRCARGRRAPALALLLDDARVCVSDAVANVVQHARVRTLAVEVTVRPHSLVVAVRDDDTTRLPWARHPGPDDERGRGLMLVRRLSHASGVTWVWDGLEIVGKRVWFELRDREDADPIGPA
ncbi:ATP-binding protein [Streptomyces sp. NPDC049577]|uniref:ATP-binding protein n=1 Tax=Streptomyces sp. NPDC049577 TaxID=3155153 RepID=UPI003423A71A